jgi:sugar lactone lactonase YvrE
VATTTKPTLSLEELEMFAFGLDHAEGICLAPDGHLYVGGEAGQLYRIERDGSVTELLSTGGFMLGLAADAESRIYAIDNVAKCVWRIDPRTCEREVYADGSPEGTFSVPNWGAFDAAGNYYLSDSGDWGERNGLIWRVRPGGQAEIWTREVTNFPNGLAVAPDRSRLYVLESYPSALVEIQIREDGSAAPRHVLCELALAVPDGAAVAEDGSIFIACYRPDTIYRWHPADGLSVFAEDPRGTVLAAPTNVVFTGDGLEELVVPNLGRWHMTRMRAGVRGVPLNYPTREQLRG